ncbi:MAG: hypothetical protein H7Z72_07120 [Bacteroidetes bacterium]|nr:hypothetical protein [Fibrella sp.]
MWSDKYYYLNIYHDKELRVDCDTNQLVSFLKSLSQLKQTTTTAFTNSDRLPLYIDITLLWTNHINSWSDKDRATQRTNLIAIVCAKDKLKDFQELKDTFIKIATFLTWQLVDEQNDEGIEDFIL